MKIIFEGRLTEPPSSIYCFRDATLYASCFVKANVLVECENHLKDSYYKWLKGYGAYDFVDQIIGFNEKENGYRIGTKKASIKVEKINYENLHIIISLLSKFKSF